MGLDMYLNRYPRYNNATPKDVDITENFLDYIKYRIDNNKQNYKFEEWCGLKLSDINLELVEFYSGFYKKKYQDWDAAKQYGYYRISDEIGYWRKANCIHNWFVNNVQNGVDDCGNYEVSKNNLEKLLSICTQVKEIATLKDLPDRKVIENAYEVAAILPSCNGFFFGSTDYDEYYLQDIDYTIEVLEKVLKETDFDRYVVYYHSSW